MGYLSNRPGDDIPYDQEIALEQLADLGSPLQYLRVNALGNGLEYNYPDLQEITNNGYTTTNPIIALSFNGVIITSEGGGTQYLSDDGTYKTIDLSGYWKNDGSSTATGNWSLGSYGFSTLGYGLFGDGFHTTIDSKLKEIYSYNPITLNNDIVFKWGIVDDVNSLQSIRLAPIVDHSSNLVAIPSSRWLYGINGSTIVADWQRVDEVDGTTNRIAFPQGITCIDNYLSVNPCTRRLYGSDGTTVMLDWATLGRVDAGSNSYYGIGENLVMKNQPYLTVSGFGLTAINGDYYQLGSINSKPQYFNNLHWIYWDGSNWKIMQNGSGTAYVSSQDVATPDLITSWDVYVSVAPAGTIVAGTDPQTIEEAYVAKRTNLGSTERQAILIDGTNDPFLDIENFSTMQGIYMNRKRLGFENVDVGNVTASYFNKGFYNKINQTGITSFITKPPQFTLSSIGWENEIYSDLNPSGQTQFGSNEALFGMTNIISKGGTYQPVDDFGIGGNLNATGLYNQLIISPSIANIKVTSNLIGIDNSVGGTVLLGVTPNYTVTVIGSKNVAGVALGSTAYPITRYGSYNQTSQSGGINYGTWSQARTQTATVNYGVWGSAELGNINWAFYNGGGNNFWGLDNVKSYYGTANDASDYYDSVDRVVNPREVGTGVFKILYGARVAGVTQSANKLNNPSFTGSANFWGNAGDGILPTGWAYNTNLVRKNAAGTGALIQPIASMSTPLYKNQWMTLTFTLSNKTAGTTLLTALTCGGWTYSGATITANGTYTVSFRVVDPTAPLSFTPADNARFYIDTIVLTSATDGDLIVDGESLVAGRSRYQGTFGEIFVDDGVTAQTVPTGTTYTLLTAFTTDGESSNMTNAAASDKITITKAGKYKVQGSFSFSGTANSNWRIALFKGGVEESCIHLARKLGAGGDVGSASFSGIISAAANTDIDVRVRHDSVLSQDITVQYANLSIIYIGE